MRARVAGPRLASYRPAAGAFTPASITGLVAWWDASDTASITASGGSVSQWNDLSGNAFHLTQGTGANQPTTGTRTQNSLNVIDFDGTSDSMAKTSVGTFVAGITVFTVVLYDTSPVSLYRYKCSGGLYDNYGGSFRTLAGGFDQVVNSSISTATAYIITEGHDGSTLHARLNAGTDNTKAHSGNSSGTGTFEIGTIADVADFHNGWIAEHISYNSWLGSTDQDAVRYYLNAKWAVY